MLAQENPEIEKAYDALQDLSNDEVIRHEAQQREMYLQNEMAINEERYEQGKKQGIKEGKEQGIKEGKKQGIKEGKEQGIKEGKEQGIKEGKKQGIREGKLEIAKNLLNVNLPLEQISNITGLSVDEIKSLTKDNDAQWK